MFQFPFNLLKNVSDIEVNYDELLEWLRYQGFEIASIEKVGDDTLIEIEVKANRPDMLSVEGVLREVYISKEIPAPTPSPCPSEPLIVSYPGIIGSGMLPRKLPCFPTFLSNSWEKNPKSAKIGYRLIEPCPLETINLSLAVLRYG